MILYAQSLGASSVVLGLIAGMLPLLVVLQIPAAGFVERIGPKPFVVTGWSVRTLFVVLLVLVPLEFVPLEDGEKLWLVVLLLFLFNAVRGVSSCGWLPWITTLVPAGARGRYLTREAGMTNIASMGAFFLAALVLGTGGESWRFSLLFLFSSGMAVVSVVFLVRLPAVPPQPGRTHLEPLRFATMWKRTAFRKLLRTNFWWSLASGGVLTFVVAFLKGRLDLSERAILLLTSLAFVGGILNQFLLRRALDRYGSKPVMALAFIIWVVTMALWAAVAGGVLPATVLVLASLMFAVGLANSLVNLANVRLAMIVVPEVGRSRYFAVYSVLSSLVLGLAPILWGTGLDLFGDRQSSILGLGVNGYSLLFGTLGLVFLVALLSSRFLEEPEAESLERLLGRALARSRLRYWIRFWFRSTPRP